jgi:tyrosinase
MHRSFTRRTFLKGSVSGVALASLPGGLALAQSTLNRLEWNDFKLTPDYATFVNAIGTMRANTNAADRTSWAYWSNIHANACPHSKPYFLAWHRGYLHYFQETLRTVSGNSQLMVPYWDYYKNATLPAEFSDPATGNPLYVEGRVNTNVRSGLTLTPFSSTYKNFQRGTTNSFETSVEYKPHGSFHNLIGGYMATLNSPMDPIFWLHHGMIDRLWASWVAADAGRTMPPLSDPYWSGNLVFRSDLSMPRSYTYNTTTQLHYTYTDLSLPTSLPPVAQAMPKLVRVQATIGPPGAGTPRAGNFAVSPPADLGGNRRSLGGAKSIRLNEKSVAAAISIGTRDVELLEMTLGEDVQRPGGGRPPASYRSAQITLNDVHTLPAGQAGGYFYDVYLLPAGGSPGEQHWIGSFGPFEVEAAHHNGGSISFAATQVLRRIESRGRSDLRVAFVRVNGSNYPRGDVITISEVRAELSQDPVE